MDPITNKWKLDRITFPRHEWQYESSNGHKKIWKNFDKKASEYLETMYEIYRFDSPNGPLGTYVTVRSGKWEYDVDFKAMKQTNTEHNDHKIRHVRRICKD